MMKASGLTFIAVLGAYGVDVALPDIWLHIYYFALVGVSVGLGLLYSKGLDYISVATVLLVSYLLENDPSLWWNDYSTLALVHAALGLALALSCKNVAFFVSIYAAKALVGALFVEGVGLSEYGYHITLNILSIMALTTFAWMSYDRGRKVRRGELPDEVHYHLRVASAWMKKTAKSWRY